MKILEYVKHHPYVIGAGVFGLGLLWLLSRGSGSSGATDAGLAGAYYGAVAADRTAAMNQQIATTNANAAVALAGIQADAYTHVQDKWADTSLATTISNNEAASEVAPYALASQYIGTLGMVASAPPTVTTKSSSGFLGIGASTKQVVTPNPNAAAAGAALTGFGFDSLLHGYLPGH
jgi:hypothetical protein